MSETNESQPSAVAAWIADYEAKLRAIGSAVEQLSQLDWIPLPETEEETEMLLAWRARHFGAGTGPFVPDGQGRAASSAVEKLRGLFSSLPGAFRGLLERFEAVFTQAGKEGKAGVLASAYFPNDTFREEWGEFACYFNRSVWAVPADHPLWRLAHLSDSRGRLILCDSREQRMMNGHIHRYAPPWFLWRDVVRTNREMREAEERREAEYKRQREAEERRAAEIAELSKTPEQRELESLRREVERLKAQHQPETREEIAPCPH